MNIITDDRVKKTIDKTIRTAVLIDGFWERWLVHGLNADELVQIRPRLTSIDHWIENWSTLANEKLKKAQLLEQQQQSLTDAESMYRTAALYYNLIQWIFPERCPEKREWLDACKKAFHHADALSPVDTKYVFLEIDNHTCLGRVRTPDSPKGCIVIVNPIDSSKEELFLYEKDFLDAGFATISFDGPGQGETYVMHGLKATEPNWTQYIDETIEYAASEYPKLPIFLFGTSFGASWAIHGSCHPKVAKAVAVSPAFVRSEMSMPDYFNERMNSIQGDEKEAFPDFDKLHYRNPVFLFHGGRDRMVKRADMDRLYNMLPMGKQFVEYEQEMHCCNNKLTEIRELAVAWYLE